MAAVLDGVVLSRAGEGFTDLFDVERIEVLRGPQGTCPGISPPESFTPARRFIQLSKKSPICATTAMPLSNPKGQAAGLLFLDFCTFRYCNNKPIFGRLFQRPPHQTWSKFLESLLFNITISADNKQFEILLFTTTYSWKTTPLDLPNVTAFGEGLPMAFVESTCDLCSMRDFSL
jgi:hypothetical protein